MSRTSVFNYFSPKTAFLDEWSTRRRAKAMQAIESQYLENESVSKVLHRYMAVLAELDADARAECVIMFGASLKWNNLMRGSQLAGPLSDVLDQTRLKHQIREEIDTRQTGQLLAVGYFAAVATWIAVEPEPFDIRAYLARLVNLMLNGMLEPPPHASAD